MGKGGSSSSENTSSSSTSTENQDNRVGAEGGGIALGTKSSININEQFGDNVARGFEKLIELAHDAGEMIVDNNDRTYSLISKATEQNQQFATDALAKIAEKEDRENKGATTVFTDIFPIAALVIVAVVVVYFFVSRKKRS